MTTPLVSDALWVTVDPTTVAYRMIRTERHRDLRAVDLPGLCPDLREDTDSSERL